MKLFRAKTFKKDYQRFKIHIGEDLLVVYYIEDDIVRLTRIGTHSQIFK